MNSQNENEEKSNGDIDELNGENSTENNSPALPSVSENNIPGSLDNPGISQQSTVSDQGDMENSGDLLDSLGTFGDMNSTSAVLVEGIEMLINDYTHKLRLLADTKDTLLERTRIVRAEMDQKLDKLQQELTDNLIKTTHQEKEKLEKTMKKCENMKSEVEDASAESRSAFASNDPTQIVSSYQRGLGAVAASKDLIDELKDSYSTVTISHELDTTSEEFKRGDLSLGQIKVTKTKREFPELIRDDTDSKEESLEGGDL